MKLKLGKLLAMFYSVWEMRLTAACVYLVSGGFTLKPPPGGSVPEPTRGLMFHRIPVVPYFQTPATPMPLSKRL